MRKKQFKRDIQKALDDSLLQSALGKFGESYPESREKAFSGYDFHSMRAAVESMKGETIENLWELADDFEKAAVQRGAHFFRAGSGEEACRYIEELAVKRGVKTIVKSKSMATEEIHLNHYLEERGLEVVETDLGEWIIQQAGQRPSHMVMPAIHLSKEQVADIFSKKLGEVVPAHIPSLVRTARQELRRKFFAADMGISGANIAVAETGTLCIFSNEGNARLTSTMPPIHVVLVGYEKLVPRFSDVALISRMLPRCATGQNTTSYLSMITGVVPGFSGRAGHDKELHIILLDNGRLEMAKDTVFREAFQCLRCAACLNVCPVYQLVGGHVYGHIYAGGIGSILTAFFHSMEDADQPQSLCLQCRKCTETCPGGIDLPKLIFALRGRLASMRGLPLTQRLIFRSFLARPRRFRGILRLAVKGQAPLSRGTAFIRQLPPPLSELARFRSLPAVAPVFFRDRFGTISQNIKEEKGQVAFFAGCMMDFIYPEIGESLVKVLNQRGIRVIFPAGQACCGAPAAYAGDMITEKILAGKNILALSATEVSRIITACPTCSDFLARRSLELFGDDPQLGARARAVAGKTIDFVRLIDILDGGPGADTELGGASSPTPDSERVTYHTSCHLKRSMGIFAEPRRVLRRAGCQLVEMKDSDRCCGLAGSYALKYPELSAPVLERKLEAIAATGAKMVVVDCPGCLMQLRGGLDKLKSPIVVRHTAEILADKIPNP